MTLINKIIRVFPKKQVHAKNLDRNLDRNLDKNFNESSVPRRGMLGEDPEMLIKKDMAKEKDMIKSDDADDDVNSKVVYEVLEREILPEKIVCPDCGGITLEGLEFCDKCGGELNY